MKSGKAAKSRHGERPLDIGVGEQELFCPVKALPLPAFLVLVFLDVGQVGKDPLLDPDGPA